MEALTKLTLNYEVLRENYQKYLINDEWDKPLTTIKIKKDFLPRLLIEDLEKVFAFKKEEYLEIDLESYYDASSLSNLIGASKGYIGYDSGGILSEHLIKHPLSLIYFKNFDKAHFTIQSFIKKLFDNAFFVDNKSRKIYLYNTIIVYNDEEKRENVIGINRSKEKIKALNEKVISL